MKLRVVIDVNASATLIGTMQRAGFKIEPDGNGMKVIVGDNSPPIPRRKVNVAFIQDPTKPIEEIKE